jgi:Diguanylate cyclase, GGDEF domain
MTGEPFLDDADCRLLNTEAFDFMFRNELKRAMRSQNYLTLLSIRPVPRVAGEPHPSTRDVARLVRRQVRETDLISRDEDGRLSVVLLDADHQSSLAVVDRLFSGFEQYAFAAPMTIAVGVACCPTHGTDAANLRRAADALQVLAKRDADRDEDMR